MTPGRLNPPASFGHSKTAVWYAAAVIAAEIKAIIEESGRGAPLVLLDSESAGECIFLHCIKCRGILAELEWSIIPGWTPGCSARGPARPPLVAAAHTEAALVQCHWHVATGSPDGTLAVTNRGQPESPPPVRSVGHSLSGRHWAFAANLKLLPRQRRSIGPGAFAARLPADKLPAYY